MQRVIEEFGAAVTAVVVASAVFTFVLGNGGISAIGAQVEQEQGIQVSYKESEVLKAVCSRERPKISYNAEKSWSAGERIPVADAFHALDADGMQLQPELLAIEDSSGNSRMELYRREDHMICPEAAGIYWVTLYAADSRQRDAKERLALIVDNGGGER